MKEVTEDFGVIDELTLDEQQLLYELMTELVESLRKFIFQSSAAVLITLVL